jgi:hypothetical protein
MKKHANRRAVTEEEREGIVAAYKAGDLIDTIAAKYGRNKSTVFSVVLKSGIALRGKGWTGHNGQDGARKKKTERTSALPEDERERIATDYAAGLLQVDIMKKYGRSSNAIRRVVELAGVPLRGRGRSGKILAMKARKKSTRAKMKKRNRRRKGNAMAASIAIANKALGRAHKKNDAIAKAVSTLIKTLEPEYIQDIFVDFGSRTYKMTRLHVEEGRVV